MRGGDVALPHFNPEFQTGRIGQADQRIAGDGHVPLFGHHVQNFSRKRGRDRGIVPHGGGRIEGALGLFHRACGLLELHPGHVQLQGTGGFPFGEFLKALVIGFGQAQGGLRLGQGAPSLRDLSLDRTVIQLNEDLPGFHIVPGLHALADHLSHDARSQHRLAPGPDRSGDRDGATSFLFGRRRHAHQNGSD